VTGEGVDWFARKRYREQFEGRGFRKLFFVVHTPSANLIRESGAGAAELVSRTRLATMAVDGGLVMWILDKIR
jgi:hypothetical protein